MNIDFEGRIHILNLKREFYKISELVHTINIKHILIMYTYKVCNMDILHKQTVSIFDQIFNNIQLKYGNFVE